MKKLLSFAALCAAFLFNACNNAPTTETTVKDSTATSSTAAAQEPTQAEKNSANMKSIYKGIETGDLSVMDGFVASDAEDHDGPGGSLKGLDTIKKMLSDIHNHISDLKIDMIADATGGDYHFSLTRMTGKTKDSKMGMPANMTISDTTIDVVKVVNGKVVEHWGFVRPPMMAGKPKMGKK